MPKSFNMSALQILRNKPWLTRVALLWFALTLGVAVASPMVYPQDELPICTSAGMVKVILHADGTVSTVPSSQAHCPLCVVGSAAPPAFVAIPPEQVQPLACVLQRLAATPMAFATAAPPPSRGPPNSL